ncbi:hypothetical protein [Lewinella sp. 4G2]|uniref:hypothetical protein n=1 Tax=Lewinella sp. 4G2 TaxID=1803372 RepID=UPI0007B4B7F2|nr:hypothetical protein [Lewinella sp. 4G2]OAV46235.1 hypothetical protein A3850_018440 [Lewinella sp. 4G2]
MPKTLSDTLSQIQHYASALSLLTTALLAVAIATSVARTEAESRAQGTVEAIHERQTDGVRTLDAQAQFIPQPNVSGTWTGKLLQNEGGIAPEFAFTMEIAHNGIFVRGTSYVSHQGIWAEMRFSGYQKENGVIVITETEILRSQKPNDLSWCMKEYELRAEYTAEGMVLTGPWWGESAYGACIPGSVRLKRKIKTA